MGMFFQHEYLIGYNSSKDGTFVSKASEGSVFVVSKQNIQMKYSVEAASYLISA